MINSIRKASCLLRMLSDAYPEGIKLEQISEKSGINKSTCVRILDTLIEEQLAERMQFALYRLGAGCFHLTRSGRFDESRLSVCRPVLKWLHKKTGHTVLISEIQNGIKYNVDYFVTDVLNSIAEQDIMVDDIYRTSAGRLIMSRLSRDEIELIVQKNGLPTYPQWKNFQNLDELMSVLEEYKKMQVVVVENKNNDCIMTGITAEIKDRNGILGALGIAYKCETKNEDYNENIERLSKLLLRAAKEMTRRLCFDK